MKLLRGFPFILFITLSGIGCAFGTRHVTLTYPPEQIEKVRAAAAAEPSDTTLRQKVFLVLLLDQRSRKQIGAVHNGFGMHTANVVATNNVAEWVTAALKTELEKAGFEVVQVANSTSRADHAVISGEVITVYCGAWTRYEAEVSFAARVVKGEKEILAKTYEGKSDSIFNWSASSKSYGRALEVALENAAEALAAELKRDLALNP